MPDLKLFYELSIEADADISKLFDYTEAKFGFEQAVKYIRELDSALQLLINTREIGKERNEIKIGLRSLPKNKHVIFYRLLEDRVRVVRVLHSSRDILKLL
jgi:toxin ParE1/3/4